MVSATGKIPRDTVSLMNDKTPSPRRTCARIIAHWLTTQDFPDRMLPNDSKDRAFIQEVVYGVTRWMRLLEWIIDTLVNREPDPQSKAYLLVGLYQIFIMDSVPEHAAANETVEAAKADLDPARIRFLNGVLRNSLRKEDAIRDTLWDQSLGIQTSHPDHVIERWTTQLGAEAAEALCNWNNERPTVSLRVNTARASFADYNAQLVEADVLTEPHPADPDRFMILPPGTSIRSLPGYDEGAFAIQDPATLVAVDLLDPSPGQRLFDACAAPGGKTFACAERMQNEGVLVAADRHEDRLAQLRENAERMAFSCVQVAQADASSIAGVTDIKKQGPFDRILLDVPCSNTGVIRRRPDARWRITDQRLRKLVGVQARMLNTCSKLLAPDGVLVYSTCSLEHEENEGQLEHWIAQNPEFKIDSQAVSIPPESGMDGAFAARIVRSAP
jgi:16S rRNA (cytosine967-C5)-methyltransferase